MQRDPTAISLVAMAIPNIPVRSQRPMREKVVNSIPINAVSSFIGQHQGRCSDALRLGRDAAFAVGDDERVAVPGGDSGTSTRNSNGLFVCRRLQAPATKHVQSLSMSGSQSEALKLELEPTRIVVESRWGHQLGTS